MRKYLYISKDFKEYVINPSNRENYIIPYYYEYDSDYPASWWCYLDDGKVYNFMNLNIIEKLNILKLVLL